MSGTRLFQSPIFNKFYARIEGTIGIVQGRPGLTTGRQGGRFRVAFIGDATPLLFWDIMEYEIRMSVKTSSKIEQKATFS